MLNTSMLFKIEISAMVSLFMPQPLMFSVLFHGHYVVHINDNTFSQCKLPILYLNATGGDKLWMSSCPRGVLFVLSFSKIELRGILKSILAICQSICTLLFNPPVASPFNCALDITPRSTSAELMG